MLVNDKEIKNLLKADLLYRLHILEEEIKLFEKKYNKKFSEFEKEVRKKENFEKWDDYLDWKSAIKELKYIKKKISEINSGNS
ncbi:hypothetical protein GWK41_02670 [Persephonella atlantica]|uniref:Uncharacterized protein n=1 Tax=Persephonella atlantica TaxID=2699429 RepID=A0ABS1GGF8_9AQUI|nr:hypothetical protein [Persephonella atlantica]MBK3331970.1 hypothetical protein [Persephonella atlantica]